MLKSKRAMQPFERPLNLAAAFHLGNLKFLDNYVKHNPDAARLLEIYSERTELHTSASLPLAKDCLPQRIRAGLINFLLFISMRLQDGYFFIIV